MSRSGPPGRTAEERAIHGTRVADTTPPSMGRGAPIELGPEAEAWIEAEHARRLAAGEPVSRRSLRLALLADWRREARAEERAGKGAQTVIRRGHGDGRGGSVSRSVLVDATVGELVARRAS